jgi:hypothetical protein
MVYPQHYTNTGSRNQEYETTMKTPQSMHVLLPSSGRLGSSLVQLVLLRMTQKLGTGNNLKDKAGRSGLVKMRGSLTAKR